MPAREERERLLEAVVDVYARRGDRGPSGRREKDGSGLLGSAEDYLLGPGEEELVAAVRATLERIVEAVSDEGGPGREPRPSATVAALGGAELTMRGELLAGRGDRWPALLPGFAYVATLPYLGDEEALRLAERVRETVDGAGALTPRRAPRSELLRDRGRAPGTAP